jgi:hypothetical protein
LIAISDQTVKKRLGDMLLDVFKQKQQAAADTGTAKPLPIPAASQVQSKPATPAPAPIQPAQPVPVQTTVQPVQPIQPSPVVVPTQPAPIQQPAQSLNPTLNIDDVYPLLLRKIKDEFKDVAGEAEKLKEMDTKMTQIVKQFTDFKKFVDDSKTNLEELKNKTEKFDVALYEILTNQFNPFIKKEGTEHEVARVETPAPVPQPQMQQAPYQRYAPEPQRYPTQQAQMQMSMPSQESMDSIKESLNEEYEKELRKIMERTKNELMQETKAMMPKEAPVMPPIAQTASAVHTLTKPNPINNPSEQVTQPIPLKNEPKPVPMPVQKIMIEDTIAESTEPVYIPKQEKLHEDLFLQNAKTLTPGVKQMETITHFEPESSDRTKVKERIIVEDVLDIPNEGSHSHEVSETLSFQETWNDPDAEHLEKTSPKLKRLDIKDLLGKFLSKHDDHSKTLDEFSQTVQAQQPQQNLPNEIVQAPYIYNKTPEPENTQHSLEELEFYGEKQRISQLDLNDPKEYFWMKNGKVARNIPELVMALTESDEATFAFHKNQGKDDFSSWINGVFRSEVVAKKIAHCNSKDEVVRLLY